jgi:DNA-directed RNA polymerase subunit omega
MPRSRALNASQEGRRSTVGEETPDVIEPKIDQLLESVDSRYTLVILAAKRAREINSYYSQLGEGRGEFVPPLVETGDLRSKPLAIALQEIADGKVTFERLEAPGPD